MTKDNMGRPKVKIIDDSVVEEPKKEAAFKAKAAPRKAADSLVAQLQAELGITEEKSVAEPKTEETASGEEEVKEATPKEAKPAETEEKPVKKAQKPGKAKPRSKKYSAKVEEINKELQPEDQEDFTYKQTSYRIPQAVELVKKLSYSKFDGTLEAHINTSVKTLRGMISLPFAAGKKLKILAFGKGAEDSGADIIGSDETLETIGQGKIDFDILITTPEWMPKLAKVAKNLGPRGLMPNPKNGTITDDLKKAVEGFQAGKTEYKTESKAPVMHLSLGKLNQPNEELEANVKMLLTTIGKSKMKKVTLAPTIGPSVKVDLTSI